MAAVFFDLASLPLDFRGVDLALLIDLFILLDLELIVDQRTAAQP